MLAYTLADMLSDVDDSRVLFSSHRATWIHSARDGLSNMNFGVYTVSLLITSWVVNQPDPLHTYMRGNSIALSYLS